MNKIDSNSDIYIFYRYVKAFIYKFPYFIFGLMPIKNNKITVITSYGLKGYACNPKGIIEELLKSNETDKYEIVWLTNNIEEHFPEGITPVLNNNLNRAYHLSTSRIWIDSHRKHLETRKRKKQLYIQTWHGPIGFKKTGKTRPKEQFSKIAEIINKNDSDMIDYCLSNSNWCTNLYRDGFDYFGDVLKVGSPRMDKVINKEKKFEIYEKYNVPVDAKILIYTPTLRNVSDNKKLTFNKADSEIDLEKVRVLLEKQTKSKWYVFLRQHPFIADKFTIMNENNTKNCIDVTHYPDVYELLSVSDILISDYSSLVFDASYVNMPVFLFVDDIEDYENDRGLLWDLDELPYLYSKNNDELIYNLEKFDYDSYKKGLSKLFSTVELLEDGQAGKRVNHVIDSFIKTRKKQKSDYLEKI